MKDLDLRKICIAEVGIDPYLLWSYVSPVTKSKAQDILDHLSKKFGDDPSLLEEKIAKEIRKIWKNYSRNKKFAKILLHIAFNEHNLISGATYDEIRKEMGIIEYNESLQKSVTEQWDDQTSNDPFNFLSKNKP